jgi:hypothetical protein
MGSFAHFSFAGVYHFDTKSRVDPVVMTIFREQDKNITVNEIAESVSCKYSTSVFVIRQRLDVMGFSIKNTKRDFEKFAAKKISELQEMLKETLDVDGENDRIDYEDIDYGWPIDEFTCREKIHVLKDFTFDDWFNAMREVIQRTCEEKSEKLIKKNQLIRYMLRFRSDDIDFPCNDIRYTLRVIAELVSGEDIVKYNYSDLVGGGYYSDDDNLVELSLSSLSQDYEVVSKIIVLTEGSTDTRVLQGSLNLLYPHLSDFYYFMDFDVSNAAGGTSYLVHAVKSFVGSGIKNRVIAIFDNDTAGKAEIKALDRTRIPPNIKVMQYPDLDLAKNYPTRGPGGDVTMDINGLACSIEMYFGSDVLGKNGGYVPIQWKNYCEKIKQYHGGFSDKEKKGLGNAFRKKIDDCRQNPNQISQTDWEPMRLLLQTIFKTFSE